MLFGLSGFSQTTWLTNWYAFINNTWINGPQYGGSKLYTGQVMDSLAAMIYQHSTASTSIGMSVPGVFSVSPSTVNGNGTFSITANPQNPNTFLAGPSTGTVTATPAYRVLAIADIPALPYESILKPTTVKTTN